MNMGAAIPQTDESFFLFDVLVGETTTRTWYGTSPRMPSRDGELSYGRIWPGNLPISQYAGTGIRMAPFTWPADGVRIQAQVRFIGDWTADALMVGGYFAIVLHAPGAWSFIETYNVAGPTNPTDFWEYRATVDTAHEGWALLDFVAPYSAVAASFAATGDLWVCALTTPPDEFAGFDVSWIQLGGEDVRPLRLRQRGDGLGMGGPRVRGVGSRQGSPRVRGYV